MKQATRELMQRPIAYQPILAKAFDSVKLALLWGQIYYWSDKGHNPEGWIYKTREELFDELGLSRREQEGARAKGLELGVLEESLQGFPSKMHFRVIPEKVGELIDSYLEKNPREIRKFGVETHTDLFGEKRVATGKKMMEEATIAWVEGITTEQAQEIATKYDTSEAQVRKSADDLVNYCKAKGKRYKNYKAALINFVKSDIARSKRGGSYGGKKVELPRNVLPAKPGKYAGLSQ